MAASKTRIHQDTPFESRNALEHRNWSYKKVRGRRAKQKNIPGCKNGSERIIASRFCHLISLQADSSARHTRNHKRYVSRILTAPQKSLGKVFWHLDGFLISSRQRLDGSYPTLADSCKNGVLGAPLGFCQIWPTWDAKGNVPSQRLERVSHWENADDARFRPRKYGVLPSTPASMVSRILLRFSLDLPKRAE